LVGFPGLKRSTGKSALLRQLVEVVGKVDARSLYVCLATSEQRCGKGDHGGATGIVYRARTQKGSKASLVSLVIKLGWNPERGEPSTKP
jgi:hypothetical protein